MRFPTCATCSPPTCVGSGATASSPSTCRPWPADCHRDAGRDRMKVKLAWLKEHLETSAPVEQLADKLSSMGLEVESIDDPGKKLAPFTIARVLEAKPH